MTTTSSARRLLLARFLVGNGLEIGPGHVPFPLLDSGVSVRYVDRWEPADNRALFPELDEDAPFPQPDIVADLDIDRLSPIEDASQDFVIASHVLEHLANPIAMLAELSRVLRNHGACVLLLPDRTKTFDRMRQPTTLDHLVAEYRDDVRNVDDAHVADFLRGIGSPLPSPDESPALFDLHRRRSIHVHCWTPDEFAEVIEFSISELELPWVALDGFASGTGNEFGFVLSKYAGPISPAELAARFVQTWDVLASASSAPSFARAAKDAVRASPLFPTLSRLRAVARRGGIGKNSE